MSETWEMPNAYGVCRCYIGSLNYRTEPRAYDIPPSRCSHGTRKFGREPIPSAMYLVPYEVRNLGHVPSMLVLLTVETMKVQAFFRSVLVAMTDRSIGANHRFATLS